MGYLVCDNCKAYYKLPKGSDYTKFRSSCICGNDLKYFESLNESSMKNFDNLICPNCSTENPKNSKFCLDCGSKLNQFETYAQKLKKSIQTKEQLQTKEQIPKNESMNKFCPSCGNENIADADFCKICGKKLEDMTGKCPYCAEEINPNAIKCKHCGEWLDKKHTTVKKEDHSGAITIGWIFTILGSILGLIISVIAWTFVLTFLKFELLNFLSFGFIISGSGFIISLHLTSRSDKRARNRGWVMFIINIFWLIIFFFLIYRYFMVHY